jgi:uncharacterized protein
VNKLPTKEEALKLLKQTGCSDSVIEHCKSVTCLALFFAERLAKNGIAVDMSLIEVGGLLHDIGRSKTHGVSHGYRGGLVAKALNLPDELVKIIERHVGAGIVTTEAVELGLPKRDYMPETLEEKIVAYADNLIDHNKRVSFQASLANFSKKLGQGHPAVERFKKLHTEISKLTGNNL